MTASLSLPQLDVERPAMSQALSPKLSGSTISRRLQSRSQIVFLIRKTVHLARRLVVKDAHPDHARARVVKEKNDSQKPNAADIEISQLKASIGNGSSLPARD